ncbi:MAG: preprotein translocase subunit YajC [Planctomycetota bacterium]
MFGLTTLLAQATTAPGAPGAPPSPTSFLQNPLIPLILVIVVFWFIMSRGKRKEQQRYQQMLSSLKRNDRVQTIGGVLGTVVDVRDDEVVLKVDETNNVKVRFNRSAIKEVLREPGAGETK